MPRLLWVVPRFGSTTVGGAERLVGELATRAMPDGWTSEIATTCAVDHYTWENELPPGETVEDGLLVRRFEVGPRDGARYEQLHPAILAGEADYAEELEWLANSVWSPGLQRFLEERGRGVRPRALRALLLRNDGLGSPGRSGAERARALPPRRALCAAGDRQARARVGTRLHVQLRGRGAARSAISPRARVGCRRAGLRPAARPPAPSLRRPAGPRPVPPLRGPDRGGEARGRRRRLRDPPRGRASGRAAARPDRQRDVRAARGSRKASSSTQASSTRRSGEPPTPRRSRSSTRRTWRASRSC